MTTRILPAVGVLIVVYNRKDDLLRLLSSLFLSDYKNFDVLLVDNNSSEDLSVVKSYPNLEYVKLNENIGFVDGMIRGATHLLEKGKYEYLWVLDSDLEVAPETLTKLVQLMSTEWNVGVAGCVIYNTYRRDIVVEAGANVCLSSGVLTPCYCNERNPEFAKSIDVDFIASGGGGSLIRCDVLKITGFHDSRYHFLWEDTDFGLCLKKNGYRSVVVTDAIVYHPPFTEKRNPNIYAYYGVRNPLLTVAKYASVGRLPYFLFNNLSRYLRIALLMKFSGCKGFAGLTFLALLDFVSGRFGKSDLVEIEHVVATRDDMDVSAEKNIYIIGTGGHDAINTAVAALRDSSSANIFLVVQRCRKTLLEDIGVDSLIVYDDQSPLAMLEYLKVGMSILSCGACVVTTEQKTASPLSYFGLRVYDWDLSHGKFLRSKLDLFSAWKPVTAVFLGNVLALLFLPVVWGAAVKHKMKRPVFP